jgi:hypothetical protein
MTQSNAKGLPGQRSHSKRGGANAASSLTTAPILDHESLGRLLEQYQHRLLSLEADLEEKQKRGQWTAESVKLRAQQLASLKKGLESLRAQNRDLQENLLYKFDIGLPKLEGMEPLEQKISEDFLTSSQKDLQQFLLQVNEVEHWCMEAAVGGCHVVQSMMRLSKLGKMIRALDLATGIIQQDHQKLTNHAKGVVGAMQGPFVTSYLAKDREKNQEQPNFNLVDRLAYWFNKLERQIAKIARLRQELKQLDVKIDQMQTWLHAPSKPSVQRASQEMPSILSLDRDQIFFLPFQRLKRARKINQKAALFLKGLRSQTVSIKHHD